MSLYIHDFPRVLIFRNVIFTFFFFLFIVFVQAHQSTDYARQKNIYIITSQNTSSFSLYKQTLFISFLCDVIDTIQRRRRNHVIVDRIITSFNKIMRRWIGLIEDFFFVQEDVLGIRNYYALKKQKFLINYIRKQPQPVIHNNIQINNAAKQGILILLCIGPAKILRKTY